MKTYLAAALVAVLIGLTPAAAEPDAARLAAAKSLLVAMGGDAPIAQSISQIKQAMIKDMGDREPTKAKDFKAFLEKELSPESERVKTFLADVQAKAAGFYADNFSTAEIEAIAAFQSSEAGRKFQQLTPNLAAVIGPLMTDFQRKVVGDLQVATNQPSWPVAPSKAAP